jgi:hypothetical protein
MLVLNVIEPSHEPHEIGFADDTKLTVGVGLITIV